MVFYITGLPQWTGRQAVTAFQVVFRVYVLMVGICQGMKSGKYWKAKLTANSAIQTLYGTIQDGAALMPEVI